MKEKTNESKMLKIDLNRKIDIESIYKRLNKGKTINELFQESLKYIDELEESEANK